MSSISQAKLFSIHDSSSLLIVFVVHQLTKFFLYAIYENWPTIPPIPNKFLHEVSGQSSQKVI